MDYPMILLSHRKREFLETALSSLRDFCSGTDSLIIVDDSGDGEHRKSLLRDGYDVRCSSPDGSAVGYLGAMQTVWEIARQQGTHVMLWEEDFVLTKPLDVRDLATLLDTHETLAQVNLQRQAVYAVERRLGYMQSHARRGYGIVRQTTAGIPWVRRRCPFTTNPGMVRREVLDYDWPTRVECDATPGGAEPAMSRLLESEGYAFGWLGRVNEPHTLHNGSIMKTGKGY